MNINGVSNAFLAFMQETPDYSQAWSEMVMKLDAANALDKKTKAIAYISVLAAVGLTGGIPYHVKHAKSFGVKREEIIGAVLMGLPAVGHLAVQALPVALAAFDDEA